MESYDSLECMEQILTHYGWDPKELYQGWRSINCPFHEDRFASASACLTGFNCHACGLQGDCVKLVMEVEKCEASRAFEIIEELTGEKHSRVREPVKRKSWGIAPFGSGDNSGGNRTLPSGIRKFPDLGG